MTDGFDAADRAAGSPDGPAASPDQRAGSPDGRAGSPDGRADSPDLPAASPDGPAASPDRPASPDGPPALRFPFDATALTSAPIRTERLVLRPIEAADAADVYEYQRLPEVIRYLPWPERDRTEGFEHTAKRAAERILAADEDFVVFAATLPGTPSTDDP